MLLKELWIVIPEITITLFKLIQTETNIQADKTKLKLPLF
jgi:hypothetical protein